MNCTICGRKFQELPNAIKWSERDGGACEPCVHRLRKTFGKYHEQFIPHKPKKDRK
jgi:DNA-directed RNA polymerase subunit RPC12/RpoP